MPGTQVLPTAGAIDPDFPTNGKMRLIMDAAEKHGGACTKKFNQAGSPDELSGKKLMAQLGVGKYYKPHNMKGVCEAMCTYWIAAHATDDDFWGWLTNDGFVKQASAKMLIEGQKQSDKMGQTTWELKLLASFGVIPQGGSNSFLIDDKIDKLTPHARAVRIADQITRGLWGYRMISFIRQGGGHAVAAWVGTDVCFMDPNYGEYWFETKAAFRAWFLDYVTINKYCETYNKATTIVCYGKSLTSLKGKRSWM